MRPRELHLVGKNTDRLERQKLWGESWVHPHLREASVGPQVGSGLDIHTQLATHQLGSLSIHFISLNLNFLVWKMGVKTASPPSPPGLL